MSKFDEVMRQAQLDPLNRELLRELSALWDQQVKYGDRTLREWIQTATELYGQDYSQFEDQHRELEYVTLEAGIATLHPLLEALDSPDDWYLPCIIDLLGDLGPHAQLAIPKLVALVDGKHSDLHYHIAHTLERIGVRSPDVVTALMTILEDADSNARLKSAQALSALQAVDHSVYLAFLKAYQIPDNTAHDFQVLLELLAKHGDPDEILPLVVKELESPLLYVRRVAIRAAVELKASSMISTELRERLMNDEDVGVRNWARSL